MVKRSTRRDYSHVPKFNGEGFTAWKDNAIIEMLGAHCWSVVNGSLPKPKEDDKSELQDWIERDNDAYYILWQIVEPHYRGPFSGTQSGKEVWAKLLKEHKGDSRAHRIKLRKDFNNPVHDPSRPVRIYIESVIQAANQLAAIDLKPDDIYIVDVIIGNLDPSFNTFKAILAARTDEVTLAQVKTILEEGERNLMPKPADAGDRGESVLYAGRGKKGKEKEKGKGRRERSGSGSDTGPGDYDWLNSKGGDACHRCGKPGHRASRCMASMPQWVKDKIMADVKFAHFARIDPPESEDEELAGFANVSSATGPRHGPPRRRITMGSPAEGNYVAAYSGSDSESDPEPVDLDKAEAQAKDLMYRIGRSLRR